MVLAHKLALLNPMITADMVEVTEFPHLANRYQVQAVPLTVINEKVRVEGAVPEARLVEKILEAIAPRA